MATTTTTTPTLTTATATRLKKYMVRVEAGHYLTSAWTLTREDRTTWLGVKDDTTLTAPTLKALLQVIADHIDANNDNDNETTPTPWSDALALSGDDLDAYLDDITGVTTRSTREHGAENTHVSLDALSVESANYRTLWENGIEITRAEYGLTGALQDMRVMLEQSPLWEALESPRAYYATGERAGEVKVTYIARAILGNYWSTGQCELHGLSTKSAPCKECVLTVDVEVTELFERAVDLIANARAEHDRRHDRAGKAVRCSHVVPCDASWADVFGFPTPIHVTDQGTTRDIPWSTMTTRPLPARIPAPKAEPRADQPVTTRQLSDNQWQQLVVVHRMRARSAHQWRPVAAPVAPVAAPVAPVAAPVAPVRTRDKVNALRSRASKVTALRSARATSAQRLATLLL